MARQIRQIDLQRAQRAFDSGDFLLASQLLTRLLAIRPDNTSWWYLLACAEGELGRLQQAERAIERGLALDPAHRGLLTRLARTRMERDDLPGAHEAIDRAIAASPDEPRPISVKAELLMVEGRLADADAVLRDALPRCTPAYPLAIVQSRVSMALGRINESADILWDLRLDETIPPIARRSLLFQLAGALDKGGRYDDAFDAASEANALRHLRFDADAFDRSIDLMIQRWRPGAVEPCSASSDRPVFIVGLPRTGTSLLEQMLSRSDLVHAAGELPLIRLTAHALALSEIAPFDHIHKTDRLHERLLAKHARDYLARSAPPHTPAPPRVTDKDPINIEHLGLISVMLPAARVIRCTRNPIDAGLSIYFQEFHSQLSWAGDLEHIARYARGVHRLVEHCAGPLGIQILDVPYEKLTSDTEATLRAVFTFLDIPFDPRALTPHESSRVVITASNQQVREPIHTRSVQRWRSYERHLQPLIAALGPLACR